MKDAAAARLQALAYYSRQKTQVWWCHRRERNLKRDDDTFSGRRPGFDSLAQLVEDST
jgi:hypothetical protein